MVRIDKLRRLRVSGEFQVHNNRLFMMVGGGVLAVIAVVVGVLYFAGGGPSGSGGGFFSRIQSGLSSVTGTQTPAQMAESPDFAFRRLEIDTTHAQAEARRITKTIIRSTPPPASPATSSATGCACRASISIPPTTSRSSPACRRRPARS
jgi:hypothetical protein